MDMYGYIYICMDMYGYVIYLFANISGNQEIKLVYTY
jgi:hypothetical protein